MLYHEINVIINIVVFVGLKYHPTSTMFINVPSVSKLQWHPFTVTSNSNLEKDKLSVMIKSEGIWSKKLYQMLSSSTTIGRLEVAVEGPYGPVSAHFLRSVFLFINFLPTLYILKHNSHPFFFLVFRRLRHTLSGL